MNKSNKMIISRVLATAASLTVSLGVWLVLVKPPQPAAADTVARPDPNFNTNDNFLAAAPDQSLPGSAQQPTNTNQAAGAVQQPATALPSSTPTVQMPRTSRLRTRAS